MSQTSTVGFYIANRSMTTQPFDFNLGRISLQLVLSEPVHHSVEGEQTLTDCKTRDRTKFNLHTDGTTSCNLNETGQRTHIDAE